MPSTAVVHPIETARAKKEQTQQLPPCLSRRLNPFVPMSREEGEDFFKDLTGDNEEDDKKV